MLKPTSNNDTLTTMAACSQQRCAKTRQMMATTSCSGHAHIFMATMADRQ